MILSRDEPILPDEVDEVDLNDFDPEADRQQQHHRMWVDHYSFFSTCLCSCLPICTGAMGITTTMMTDITDILGVQGCSAPHSRWVEILGWRKHLQVKNLTKISAIFRPTLRDSCSAGWHNGNEAGSWNCFYKIYFLAIFGGFLVLQNIFVWNVLENVGPSTQTQYDFLSWPIKRLATVDTVSSFCWNWPCLHFVMKR